MENGEYTKGFLLLLFSLDSDKWNACIHTSLVTGRRPEQATAKVRERACTKQTEGQRLLVCLFYIAGPKSLRFELAR